MKHFKSYFSRFGIAEEIFTDQDPMYKSKEFDNFCKFYEITKDFSSARYPQSNGMAERSVQHVKNLIRKCSRDNSDFNLALLEYKNTPLDSKLGSPAQILMKRNLRTLTPCIQIF